MRTQAGKLRKWVIGVLLVLAGNNFISVWAARDSIAVYQGKIIDADSRLPIMYASIFVEGTNVGTVANAEGEFMLKVPLNNGGRIGFSHLGYKTIFIPRNEMKASGNVIALKPEIVSLQEIIVRVEDPELIIRGALANISKNYSRKPAMINGFYRETIQQNRRYVSVAEAVLEAYKSPYNNYFLNDKVRVLIGRKSQDVKKMDTVVVKFQGGPVLPFFIDIAKNPENIINESFFNQYTLKLSGQVSLDDIRCYVVEFKQRKDVNQPLYEGKFYIDVNNLAFAAAEFSVSEYGLPYATSTYIKKKPATMKVDILRANYYVKYNKTGDVWQLAYTRSELAFKCKWAKKLFSSNYVISTEMAVTDIDYNNVEKIKMAEAFKSSEVFSDRVEDFRNDDFWGDYNIIVPEESVLTAIKKLNRKLMRQQ